MPAASDDALLPEKIGRARPRLRRGSARRLRSMPRAAAGASLREFECEDLLRYAKVNTDPLTETFNPPFYLGYLARWPEYWASAASLSERHVVGYGAPPPRALVLAKALSPWRPPAQSLAKPKVATSTGTAMSPPSPSALF